MKFKKSIAFAHFFLVILILFSLLFFLAILSDKKEVSEIKISDLQSQLLELKNTFYLIKFFEEQSFPVIVEKSKKDFILLQEMVVQNKVRKNQYIDENFNFGTKRFCFYEGKPSKILWYDREVKNVIDCFPYFNSTLFLEILEDEISKYRYPDSLLIQKNIYFDFSTKFDERILKIESLKKFDEKSNLEIKRTNKYKFNFENFENFLNLIETGIKTFKDCIEKSQDQKKCITEFEDKAKIGKDLSVEIKKTEIDEYLFQIEINFNSFKIFRYLFI